MEVIFTEEQLHNACTKWQRILRLQDWTIQVSIVRESELLLPDVMGTVSVTLEKRLAKIQIMDPIDYPPSSMLPQDMELTLVHELLHLHLWPFTRNTNGLEQVAEEQAIEAISKGLIDVNRRG